MTEQNTVRLAGQTSPAITTAIEDGVRTVVVGVGSIEQHGPHLPIRMDSLAGDELSRRVAERLDDAFAAPTIRPGCSGHHMAFAGTISIPAETLMETIRGYCESLDAHGFEYIVLMPTHGGNFAPTNTVAPEIARDIDAHILTLADFDQYMGLIDEGLTEAGVEYEEPVNHAGAGETSMVLAADPDLVDEDAIEPGHEEKVSASRLISGGFDAVTENGVVGNPTEATTAAGETILEHVASTYAQQIRTERAALSD